MLQGLIAGWIFILSMASFFADDNLRHVMPVAFGAFLVAALVTIPVWMPRVLSNKNNRNKIKKQVVEIRIV